mmetsp:Transcript_29527/g.62729  ORF Transcript_29527/g.62729 Transcript_29527/m.62729 type:complete len:113 (+) Transcript_29527:814-1152(+)
MSPQHISASSQRDHIGGLNMRYSSIYLRSTSGRGTCEAIASSKRGNLLKNKISNNIVIISQHPSNHVTLIVSLSKTSTPSHSTNHKHTKFIHTQTILILHLERRGKIKQNRN